MYIPTTDFDVVKPDELLNGVTKESAAGIRAAFEELRRDLQQLDRNIASAFSELQVPASAANGRKVSSATAAQFGEFLVIDTSDASVIVTLPQVSNNRQTNAWKAIGILRKSTSNTLTLQCVGADLINGASSYTVAAAFGLFLVVFDGAEYWVR